MAEASTRGAFVGTGARGLRGSALAAAAPQEVVTEGAFDPRFDGETFFLQLENKNAGWIFEPQGGEASGEVVTEKLGPDHIAKKHIGNVKYNEFTLKAGVGMTKGLYEWVKSSFDKSFTRKSGEVIAADFNYRPKAVARFTDALITEITVPTLDVARATKDPAYMVLKVQPKTTSYEPPSTQDVGGSQTKPSPVDFKFKIDGVDMSRVTKIDSFTVKQGYATAADGSVEPAYLEIPNLSVWVDPGVEASSIKDLMDWHDDFLLKGNSGDDKERSGSLAFFNPKEIELFRFSFGHLGMFKGSPEDCKLCPDSVKIELYCEDIAMTFGDAPWG